MEIDWQRLGDDDYYTNVCTIAYDTYQQRVLRYCVTRLGDHFGEDVMQEEIVAIVSPCAHTDQDPD